MPAQAWREVALPAFVIDVHRTLYVSGSMRVTLQEPRIRKREPPERLLRSGVALSPRLRRIHAKRTPFLPPNQINGSGIIVNS